MLLLHLLLLLGLLKKVIDSRKRSPVSPRVRRPLGLLRWSRLLLLQHMLVQAGHGLLALLYMMLSRRRGRLRLNDRLLRSGHGYRFVLDDRDDRLLWLGYRLRRFQRRIHIQIIV